MGVTRGHAGMSDGTGNDAGRLSGAEGERLDPAVARRLKRDDRGLVAAVVQQYDSREVLMVGYMNDEALRRTLTTGRVTFWSRSRQDYWRKGDTSGYVPGRPCLAPLQTVDGAVDHRAVTSSPSRSPTTAGSGPPASKQDRLPVWHAAPI